MIDFLLATKNRLQHFKEAVQNLADQSMAGEISLYVMCGSDNEEVEDFLLHQSWPFKYVCLLFDSSEFGDEKVFWSRIYNRLAELAQSKYLTYWSDDIYFDSPEGCKEGVEFLEDNEDCGTVIFDGLVDERYDGSKGTHHLVNGMPTVSYGFFRRKAFNDVERFDPRYRFYYADSDLTMKVFVEGWRICKIPTAVTHKKMEWVNSLGKDLKNNQDAQLFFSRWIKWFPEKFFEPAEPEKYWETVARGYERMSKSAVAICATCRNIDPWDVGYVDAFMARVHHLALHFDKYTTFVFENDSDDAGTRKQLQAYCQQNDFNTKIIFQNLGMPFFKGGFTKDRMTLLSYCRNRYLLECLLRPKRYDYMIVIDSDLFGGFSYDGIAHSIGLDGWDGMFANGLRHFDLKPDGSQYEDGKPRLVYYDTLPLKMPGQIAKPHRIPMDLIRLQQGFTHHRGEPIIPVDSGFGGLGIYKMAAIQNCFYTPEYQSEHIGFHKAIIDRGGKLFVNPSQLVLYNLSEVSHDAVRRE